MTAATPLLEEAKSEMPLTVPESARKNSAKRFIEPPAKVSPRFWKLFASFLISADTVENTRAVESSKKEPSA